MPSNSLSIRIYNSLSRNTFWLIYLPLIIYWLFLFIVTSIPIDNFPDIFKTQDKLEHFLAYFILSILLFMSLNLQQKFVLIAKHALAISVFIIILYAAIDEIHQLLIPGRYCDLYDWIADVLGGIIGLFLVKYFFKEQLTH